MGRRGDHARELKGEGAAGPFGIGFIRPKRGGCPSPLCFQIIEGDALEIGDDEVAGDFLGPPSVELLLPTNPNPSILDVAAKLDELILALRR